LRRLRCRNSTEMKLPDTRRAGIRASLETHSLKVGNIKERKREMKHSLFMGILFASMCLSLASCGTFKHSDATIVPFTCIVQSETEILYEIHLDGNFISSGKTLPSGKGMQMCEMTAIPGDHVLMVTAPGYETWQRVVTIMSGTKHGSHFRIDLNKSVK